MNEKDYIGMRGETVFAFLIGKRCNKRFWFVAEFLGGKAETKDFSVALIGASCGEATFFVQVKATTKGYSGKGASRKLRASVTRADVRKLKLVTGPAFVAGIDVSRECGFLMAVTKNMPDKGISGIPCKHAINCTLIPRLWDEVEAYWSKRNMVAEKSLFE
jgi:hypothetical protein